MGPLIIERRLLDLGGADDKMLQMPARSIGFLLSLSLTIALAAAPAPAAPAPGRERAQASGMVASPAERAKVAAAPPSTAAAARSRADADSHAQTVEARIERMRALRTEGKATEAIEELARFRAAFDDADARLPDDLRAWAQSLPR